MKKHVITGALLISAAFVAVGSGSSAPSRIVDRTFVCTPIAYGGARDLDVWASPLRSDSRWVWKFQAHLVVRTGTTLPDTDLVYVRARAQGGIGQSWPFPGPAGVFANERRCSPSRARIPLSPTSLPGPPTRWYTTATCQLHGRVVVRVRALLAAPTEWRPTRGAFAGARKSVEEASLAVRSERTGAPLAFMEVDESGRTRFWGAPLCR